jgi:[histone H3]-lysine36 N-dimethyltransferase SETMAR
MECTNDKLYFLIESLRRNDMKGTEIHSIIQRAWPEEAMNVRRVQQIMEEFRKGQRTSFDRASGTGKQKSEARTEGMHAVEEAINEDCTLTLRDITNRLDISTSMAYRILTEDLGRKWLLTRWIPHELTEQRKVMRCERINDMLEAFNSRIVINNLVTIDEKWFYCRPLRPRNKIGSWTTAEGDRIQTPRRTPMEKKFMAIVAVSLRGHHYFKVLNRNECVNSTTYIAFLEEMALSFQNQDERHPIRMENMCLVQDNARPHVSHATMTFLSAKNVRLLKQPPYSPDCNLCDRYIFARLESLRNDVYDTKEDLEDFLRVQLPTFHGERMKTALQNMRADFQSIVDKGGEYL